MKYSFIIAIMCWSLSVVVAQAYVPVFTEQPTLHDIETIQDPRVTQLFFGELIGAPHTYEISASEPFTLSLELRTPRTASSTGTISSIVVKVPGRGRVEEVTRLVGRDASWEEHRDEMTKDVYLRGATYHGDLGPGTYHIEVHTPDNMEKYMLKVGTEDEMIIGYVELLSRLRSVKHFYGTSPLWLVATPYVYVPLLMLCGLGLLSWHVWKRRTREA